jgi:hypothetical protein
MTLSHYTDKQLLDELRSRKQPKVSHRNLKPTRGREIDRSHKGAVARLFCVATFARTGLEAYGVQVAHLRMSADGVRNPGMQRKPDDAWTLPLLPAEHARQHAGKEAEFWAELGISPHQLCRDLKAASPDHESMCAVLRSHGDAARLRRAI